MIVRAPPPGAPHTMWGYVNYRNGTPAEGVLVRLIDTTTPGGVLNDTTLSDGSWAIDLANLSNGWNDGDNLEINATLSLRYNATTDTVNESQDFQQVANMTLTNLSNISWTSPSSGSNYTIDETVNLTCRVMDTDSSQPIQSYPVEFWWWNSTVGNTSIGTNNTNNTGYATKGWDTTGKAEGTYYTKCNITDNATLQYNVSSTSWVNISLNLTPCSIAVGVSDNLSSGINWTISTLPVTNQSADDNNGTGITGYYVNMSVTGTCTADVYIKADGNLSSNGNNITLANEKYRNNTTDSTVPGTNNISLDTTYAGNQIGSNLTDGEKIYLKFYLSVSGGQAAATYTNNVSIKGVKAGETP